MSNITSDTTLNCDGRARKMLQWGLRFRKIVLTSPKVNRVALSATQAYKLYVCLSITFQGPAKTLGKTRNIEQEL